MSTIALTKTANSDMALSSDARAKMRHTEKEEYRYYNDMKKLGGNCTWGIGIKAHNGPCTGDELKKNVSAAQVEAAFSSKVAEAERGVRRRVTKQALTQPQFDALVSLSYNLGINGSLNIFDLVDGGNQKAAGRLIASMIKARVKGADGKTKFVVLKGLIVRRAGESAPFLSAEK